MNVYAYQLDIVWEDKSANFEKVTRWTQELSPEAGSLLVLPEMFATGFSMNVDVTQEPEHGATSGFLKKLARETACFVIGGLTTTRPHGNPTNDALLIDPVGNPIGNYSKLHPFSMGKEGEHYAAGDEVCCFELPNGLRVCPFICYDLRFPEIFRKAMCSHRPPHLFTVIANWPNKRTMHWVRLLEARAIENLAYVIGVNRSGSDPYLDYDGRTLIIDSLGKILSDAGNEEGVIQSKIELDVVEEWRRDFPALRDRRDA